ncbi:unnamed protein product, partial [Ectocarpus sp. 12 AP-2014]
LSQKCVLVKRTKHIITEHDVKGEQRRATVCIGFHVLLKNSKKGGRQALLRSCLYTCSLVHAPAETGRQEEQETAAVAAAAATGRPIHTAVVHTTQHLVCMCRKKQDHDGSLTRMRACVLLLGPP